MRCGFCNLFTRPVPPEEQVRLYLDTLERQIQQVSRSLGDFHFSQMSLGGGTPTYLTAEQLARLLALFQEHLGVTPAQTPTSVETSPATATQDRLELLRKAGVTRISMGVQSLVPKELTNISRPEAVETTRRALESLQQAGFPTVNLDLMYGIPGQTEASFLSTLEETLTFRPQEVYLYPLYVRPLTGLGRRGSEATDLRPTLYRQGRALLLAGGYRQISMRFFQRPPPPEISSAGRRYRCQEDGLVGLGCGARSYTRRLHYSSDYAVSSRGVRSVLEAWIARSDEEFAQVDYGIDVSLEESRHRIILQSLLRCEGVNLGEYHQLLGAFPEEHLPGLRELIEQGLATQSETHLRLTPEGLLRSDLIGPFLYSEAVRRRMQEFSLK
jgi:oxygen-independent coproporphyrinogen-3 oxidase